MAGVVYIAEGKSEGLSAPKSIALQNIKVDVRDSFSLSSVVDNSNGNDKKGINPDDFMISSSGAVSGGLVGMIYRDSKMAVSGEDNMEISLSNISFLQTGMGYLIVASQTQDENSVGIAFSVGSWDTSIRVANNISDIWEAIIPVQTNPFIFLTVIRK